MKSAFLAGKTTSHLFSYLAEIYNKEDLHFHNSMEREGLLGDIKDNQSTSTSRNRCYIHVITVLLLLFFIGIRNHSKERIVFLTLLNLILDWKPSTTDLTKVAALPPESLFNTTTDENEDPLFAYNS